MKPRMPIRSRWGRAADGTRRGARAGLGRHRDVGVAQLPGDVAQWDAGRDELTCRGDKYIPAVARVGQRTEMTNVVTAIGANSALLAPARLRGLSIRTTVGCCRTQQRIDPYLRILRTQ